MFSSAGCSSLLLTQSGATLERRRPAASPLPPHLQRLADDPHSATVVHRGGRSPSTDPDGSTGYQDSPALVFISGIAGKVRCPLPSPPFAPPSL